MFDTLQNKVNAAAFAKLSNAVATIGGTDIDVILDKAYQESFGVVSGSLLAITVPSTVNAAEGDVVVIASNSYKVASAEPDGSGTTLLVLK